MNEAILTLGHALESKQPAVLATVIEVAGASPAKVGDKVLLSADDSTAGTVGGGKLEAAILSDCHAARVTGQPRITHYSLAESGEQAIGTLCGGDVRVFIEPYGPPPRLVVVGGGHVGRPLEAMGRTVGFDVVIVDVEPGRATVPELDALVLTEDSHVALLTTDHVSDEAALRMVITSPAGYIGMIGSRSKCDTILAHLRADGITEAQLSRVYAPVGLDLGGPTPQEIALAILAEIVAVRRGGSARMRSQVARTAPTASPK